MAPKKFPKATRLGMFEASQSILNTAMAIEEGRWVARDIGGSDPERMAAGKIVEYLELKLKGLENIQMTVDKVDKTNYPLMAAVNRAASGIFYQFVRPYIKKVQ